ncbi:hypothetical protein CRG98_013728 [Punica granatum]|uniref:Uncharacterized protein n=1 Tax=Punica granatum TaxID=22663 RepID=A0A2I0KBH1_PUNGR|nr:hypothetical protein CRG98_013728 [Punica granatum]
MPSSSSDEVLRVSGSGSDYEASSHSNNRPWGFVGRVRVEENRGGTNNRMERRGELKNWISTSVSLGKQLERRAEQSEKQSNRRRSSLGQLIAKQSEKKQLTATTDLNSEEQGVTD